MSLPEPYYQDDYVTIYNADCREILPELDKVDLTLTDPPYGMSFQSNHRKEKHLKIAGDAYLPLDLINVSISKANNAAYIFCRWDNLYDLPKPRSVIAWVKNNWSMGDLKHEHGRQWEACCFYCMDGHKFIKRIPDVIKRPRTGNNLHPTEKPVDLITEIIACNIGGTILDPFAGSCTTAVAAKQLGRKCICIELEEKYCTIGVKRLQQEYLAL